MEEYFNVDKEMAYYSSIFKIEDRKPKAYSGKNKTPKPKVERPHLQKAVIKIEESGEETRYNSLKQASEETGIAVCGISGVINGIKTHYRKTKWRYAD